ncbi:DUF488 domain-containing protein [Alistipes sp.]|uniref:DUF488 domain-containing protein n=1 Tax=Alistipes sp. TaxID=1872444 RepID=UPI003AF0FB69
MTQIRIKRVYEPASPDDGCRILVDRLWPRGLRKDTLRYDIWAKEITPSDDLRRWFHADPEARWEEFRRRYLAQLRASDAVGRFVEDISRERTVTLLYASKQTTRNHALVLQEYLQKALGQLTAARSE